MSNGASTAGDADRPPPVVDADGLRRLIDEGTTQVVEVLGADEYAWAHLPGAVHVPLADIGRSVPDAIDATRPAVVYCNDFL